MILWISPWCYNMMRCKKLQTTLWVHYREHCGSAAKEARENRGRGIRCIALSSCHAITCRCTLETQEQACQASALQIALSFVRCTCEAMARAEVASWCKDQTLRVASPMRGEKSHTTVWHSVTLSLQA
jgi:hypothetical protein